jgi:hypothetical protein
VGDIADVAAKFPIAFAVRVEKDSAVLAFLPLLFFHFIPVGVPPIEPAFITAEGFGFGFGNRFKRLPALLT